MHTTLTSFAVALFVCIIHYSTAAQTMDLAPGEVLRSQLIEHLTERELAVQRHRSTFSIQIFATQPLDQPWNQDVQPIEHFDLEITYAAPKALLRHLNAKSGAEWLAYSWNGRIWQERGNDSNGPFVHRHKHVRTTYRTDVAALMDGGRFTCFTAEPLSETIRRGRIISEHADGDNRELELSLNPTNTTLLKVSWAVEHGGLSRLQSITMESYGDPSEGPKAGLLKSELTWRAITWHELKGLPFVDHAEREYVVHHGGAIDMGKAKPYRAKSVIRRISTDREIDAQDALFDFRPKDGDGVVNHALDVSYRVGGRDIFIDGIGTRCKHPVPADAEYRLSECIETDQHVSSFDHKHATAVGLFLLSLSYCATDL